MSDMIATISPPQEIVAVVEAGTSAGSSSLAAYDAALLKTYNQAKEDYYHGKTNTNTTNQ
ncbi:hypothetical protein DPV93_05115 [Haemophilus sputorum]|uniref:Uncharacterized protein n=1 Tax=Haemophilus sputorum TaxID=1078480 RepID=A0A369YD17_9PAST|nr:hypothetical protein [Haemophilus sputorum]RDE72662.1 hypothetical protein DPV93_05115 [Haemophilus sputorum]